MRPVNLIPSDERRGERTAMRGGPAAYIVVGALVAALAGVTALVITDNQISDRKAEVTRLKEQEAVAQARAQRLAAYTHFGTIRDQRVSTVTSLADSRFDWERVMRELSLVLPDDVWLTNLTGKANPTVQIEGEANIALRGSISGPALELAGCARGQEAVARFVSVLKEIDGVTRVGVQSSQLGSQGAGGDAAPSLSGVSTSTSGCQTREFVAQFEIVAAFDAAPVATAGAGAVPSTPAPSTTSGAAPASTPTSTPGG
ncbi:MAG: PilN domain-containing protein [Solirubrobacterales bacterium]